MAASKHTPVPYLVARERVLRYMFKQTPRLYYANELAVVIWPDHQMTSQGAGGAASRVLKNMESEGLVVWTVARGQYGYKLTAAGRIEAERLASPQ